MRKVLFAVALLPLFFATAYGEELDILELNRYQITEGNPSSINSLKIDDNTMVVALGYVNNNTAQVYQGAFIKTFEITSYGTINEISSMQYDPPTNTRTYENKLLKIDDDTFVMAYSNITPPDNDYEGLIKTFDISPDGTITEVDSTIFESRIPELTLTAFAFELVDEDTVVLAYNYRVWPDPNWTGYMKTFDISSTGTITPVLTYSNNPTLVSHVNMIKMNPNNFILAYHDADAPIDNAFVTSYEISADGTSIIKKNSAYVSSSQVASNFELVKINDNDFAVAYNEWPGAGDSSGHIKTFKINSTGGINEYDHLIHDVKGGTNNSFEQIAPGIFVLHYFASQPEGEKVKLFEINNNLEITETNVYPYGIGNPNHYSQESSLLQMNGPLLAVAHDHRNPDGERVGSIQTFVIENLPVETNTNGDIQIQLDTILSQITSLTDLIIQNIADITNLQTQIDDLSTQSNDEEPLLPPELLTLYSTNGTNFLYNANGTSNLFMCTPIE